MKKNTDIVFALYGGNVNGNEFETQCLIGTLFCIGGDFFITAGHVLEQAKKYDKTAIGIIPRTIDQKSDSITLIGVGVSEIFEDIDIGIIRSLVNKHQCLTIPKWSLKKYMALDDVFTYGFPFGLKPEERGVYLRSLKGYIVSTYQFKIPNSGKADCYELSMHCPRGISGAPLLTEGGLIGIIIGNAHSEIEISSEEEMEEDSNSKIIYIKTETIKYGIAIQNSEIFKLYSTVLEKTIKEHLMDYDLLV